MTQIWMRTIATDIACWEECGYRPAGSPATAAGPLPTVLAEVGRLWRSVGRGSAQPLELDARNQNRGFRRPGPNAFGPQLRAWKQRGRSAELVTSTPPPPPAAIVRPRPSPQQPRTRTHLHTGCPHCAARRNPGLATMAAPGPRSARRSPGPRRRGRRALSPDAGDDTRREQPHRTESFARGATRRLPRSIARHRHPRALLPALSPSATALRSTPTEAMRAGGHVSLRLASRSADPTLQRWAQARHMLEHKDRPWRGPL